MLTKISFKLLGNYTIEYAADGLNAWLRLPWSFYANLEPAKGATREQMVNTLRTQAIGKNNLPSWEPPKLVQDEIFICFPVATTDKEFLAFIKEVEPALGDISKVTKGISPVPQSQKGLRLRDKVYLWWFNLKEDFRDAFLEAIDMW